MSVDIKQYPYEMYCLSCNHVPAYLDHKPKEGDRIVSQGAINVDGTMPNPGDEIFCYCPRGQGRLGWGVRERKETPTVITSFPGEAVDRHLKLYGHLPELGCCEHDQPLSKCCNARMVAGGVQCEACGSNGE